MAALVSSQSAFLLDDHPSPGGILLNSRSLSVPLHREQRQPPSFASSSSSASESRSRSSTFGDASSRKIRFAPLPDPRARADLQDVFDDSDSDSLTNSHLSRNASAPPNYSPVLTSPAQSALSLTDNELHSDDPTFREKVGKQKNKKWSQKLLGPLLHPLLPSSTSKCEDASQNIFRGYSRDSTKASNPSDDGYKGGVPLGRRMSTGCRDVPYQKETERSQTFRDGAPLVHVLSENGGSSKGRKDGQRMLNGRVYGRRASSADRQRRANKHNQLASEPEFVEWGYGGMGSVNNDHNRGRASTAGPDWAKVQSRGKVLGEREEDADPEGDDGSGMGWVRRRREQRERLKKEQEEGEKDTKKEAVPDIEVHPPETKQEESVLEPVQRSESAEGRAKEEEHVYRAVSVPAPHHHHTRHHSYHKSGDASGTVTPTSAPSLSRVNSASSVPFNRTSSLGSQGEVLLLSPEEKKVESESPNDSGSSVKSLASTTSSESLNDDEEDTERESDEEEGDEESRITSKGAGVEKISRHKQ